MKPAKAEQFPDAEWCFSGLGLGSLLFLCVIDWFLKHTF